MNEFKLVNADTDAITICKKGGESFSNEEISNLTKELNSLFPEGINWEFEFYIPKMAVVRPKNYILYDGKTIKLKGSSLKATTKEPALKEFMKAIINSIVFDRDDFKETYNNYVKEIMQMPDIKRWASRKTISEKILKGTRLNETKVMDAMQGEEFSPGDRRYFFFLPDNTLELVENFNGEYSQDRLLKKLHDTSKVFSTILPVQELFINYSLKKNKPLLEQLLAV